MSDTVDASVNETLTQQMSLSLLTMQSRLYFWHMPATMRPSQTLTMKRHTPLPTPFSTGHLKTEILRKKSS